MCCVFSPNSLLHALLLFKQSVQQVISLFLWQDSMLYALYLNEQGVIQVILDNCRFTAFVFPLSNEKGMPRVRHPLCLFKLSLCYLTLILNVTVFVLDGS